MIDIETPVFDAVYDAVQAEYPTCALYNDRPQSMAKFPAVVLVEQDNLTYPRDRGEEKHIKPFRENATIHIDTFHDYEPCILAMYLREMPEYKNELTPDFVAEHGLSDLIELVESVPPLITQYVPRDSVLREFVGGSAYKY